LLLAATAVPVLEGDEVELANMESDEVVLDDVVLEDVKLEDVELLLVLLDEVELDVDEALVDSTDRMNEIPTLARLSSSLMLDVVAAAGAVVVCAQDPVRKSIKPATTNGVLCSFMMRTRLEVD